MEEQVILYPVELLAEVCGEKAAGNSPTELYVHVMEVLLRRYPELVGKKETHFTSDSVRAGQYTGTTRSVLIGGRTVYIKTGFSTKDKWKGIEKTCQLVDVGFVLKESLYMEPILASGMIIPLGKYQQEIAGNPQDIRWLVLEVQGNKALILSIDCIEAKPFDELYEEISSWHSCTLRKWLNYDFICTAFSDKEKAMLLKSKISCDGTMQNATEDYVFLLSKKEVERYFPCVGDRKAYTTPHAISNGADADASEGFSGPWWLRSKGKYDAAMEIVTSSGDFHNYLSAFNGVSVRPAIWIDIEKYANEGSNL